MTIAILIPLYRPRQRHVLLLKSVLSACKFISDISIYVVADGPASAVDWPEGFIDQILTIAASAGHEVHIYSFIQPRGYPGCYRQLLEDAIADSKVVLFHFVDQDDYCLPSRFIGRGVTLTQASSTIVVNERLTTLAMHRFDSSGLIALLETPAPGMTFSVPRSIVIDYLNLCRMNSLIANSPHDYVISQIAHHQGTLFPVFSASMLYIQHQNNTIGHVRGLHWFLKKIQTFHEVVSRTHRHAALLDLLYGGRHWIRNYPLHRSKMLSLLYHIILRFG